VNLLKHEPQPLPLLSISEDAEDYRNKLALAARSVVVVTDPASNLQARNVAVEIRSHLKAIEAERVRLSKPLLAGQRLLNRLSEDHNAPLVDALARLERLGADYLLTEQRRVEREKTEQDAALLKLMKERYDLEAGAAQAASECTTEAELDQALEIEARAREAALAMQSAVAAPLPEMDKTRGQSLRQVMCYEIMDIEALRQAKPDCVKLVPSPAMIQELCVPELPTPGILCWWEPRLTYSTR